MGGEERLCILEKNKPSTIIDLSLCSVVLEIYFKTQLEYRGQCCFLLVFMTTQLQKTDVLWEWTEVYSGAVVNFDKIKKHNQIFVYISLAGLL